LSTLSRSRVENQEFLSRHLCISVARAEFLIYCLPQEEFCSCDAGQSPLFGPASRSALVCAPMNCPFCRAANFALCRFLLSLRLAAVRVDFETCDSKPGYLNVCQAPCFALDCRPENFTPLEGVNHRTVRECGSFLDTCISLAPRRFVPSIRASDSSSCSRPRSLD
jgi:hypothetical protein